MEEQWFHYLRFESDGERLSVIANLAYWKKPVATHPTLCKVVFENIYPKGMEIGEALKSQGACNVEESMDRLMKEADYVIFLGRYLGRGAAVAFFAMNQENMDEAHVKVMEEVWVGFKAPVDRRASINVMTANDPGWGLVNDELMPTREEFRYEESMQVVRQLMKVGDDVEAVRDVDHAAVFDEKDGAEAFAKAAAGRGYKVESVSQAESGAWWVTLTKAHASKIDVSWKVASEVEQLAEANGGTYDGWGCMVVQKRPSVWKRLKFWE